MYKLSRSKTTSFTSIKNLKSLSNVRNDLIHTQNNIAKWITSSTHWWRIRHPIGMNSHAQDTNTHHRITSKFQFWLICTTNFMEHNTLGWARKQVVFRLKVCCLYFMVIHLHTLHNIMPTSVTLCFSHLV